MCFTKKDDDNDRDDGNIVFADLQRQMTALTTELEVARDERAGVAAKRQELERTVRVSVEIVSL